MDFCECRNGPGFIRGTTPDFLLTIPDYDVTGMWVKVTLSQGYMKITNANDELYITVDENDSEIGFSLSQADTFLFTTGKMEIQVKIIDENGHVDGTETGIVDVDRALLEEVINYGY